MWSDSDLVKKGFVKDSNGNWVKGEAPKIASQAKQPMATLPQKGASPDLTIIIRQHIPGLNGSDGLIRENRFARKKRKEKIMAEIAAQPLAKFKGKVEVTYERKCIKFLDWDNFGASFKLIGDSLVDLGIIQDDSPKYISTFIPVQTRVYHRVDEMTIIFIKKVAD